MQKKHEIVTLIAMILLISTTTMATQDITIFPGARAVGRSDSHMESLIHHSAGYTYNDNDEESAEVVIALDRQKVADVTNATAIVYIYDGNDEVDGTFTCYLYNADKDGDYWTYRGLSTGYMYSGATYLNIWVVPYDNGFYNVYCDIPEKDESVTSKIYTIKLIETY